MGDIEILRPHKKGEAPITLAKIKRYLPEVGGMEGGMHFKGAAKKIAENPNLKSAFKGGQDLVSWAQSLKKQPKPFTTRVLKKIKGRSKTGKIVSLGLKLLEEK